MIGWYVGLIGIFVGIIAGIYFIKSLLNMRGDLKKSIFYLASASFIYVVFSSVMVILGLIQYPITNLLWEIVPILFALSAFIFIIGSYKLVKLLNDLSEKRGKK